MDTDISNTPWCLSGLNCKDCVNGLSKRIFKKWPDTKCPLNCRINQKSFPIALNNKRFFNNLINIYSESNNNETYKKLPISYEEFLIKSIDKGILLLDKSLHIANLLNLDLDGNKETMPDFVVSITAVAAKLFHGMWQDCLYYQSTISQKQVILVDMNYSDEDDIAWIIHNFPTASIICTQEKWNRWNWREALIRALDDIAPKYVIFLDQDETFDSGFEAEFNQFAASDKEYMYFKFQNPMDHFNDLRIFPAARHMKAFKWKPNLTYKPYQGYAKINGLTEMWPATVKVNHWCYYNDHLRKTKVEHR